MDQMVTGAAAGDHGRGGGRRCTVESAAQRERREGGEVTEERRAHQEHDGVDGEAGEAGRRRDRCSAAAAGGGGGTGRRRRLRASRPDSLRRGGRGRRGGAGGGVGSARGGRSRRRRCGGGGGGGTAELRARVRVCGRRREQGERERRAGRRGVPPYPPGERGAGGEAQGATATRRHARQCMPLSPTGKRTFCRKPPWLIFKFYFQIGPAAPLAI